MGPKKDSKKKTAVAEQPAQAPPAQAAPAQAEPAPAVEDIPAQPSTSTGNKSSKRRNEASLLSIVNTKYVLPTGSSKRAAASKPKDYKIGKVQSKKGGKKAEKAKKTEKTSKKTKKD